MQSGRRVPQRARKFILGELVWSTQNQSTFCPRRKKSNVHHALACLNWTSENTNHDTFKSHNMADCVFSIFDLNGHVNVACLHSQLLKSVSRTVSNWHGVSKEHCLFRFQGVGDIRWTYNPYLHKTIHTYRERLGGLSKSKSPVGVVTGSLVFHNPSRSLSFAPKRKPLQTLTGTCVEEWTSDIA